jgi:hypothetical protein
MTTECSSHAWGTSSCVYRKIGRGASALRCLSVISEARKRWWRRPSPECSLQRNAAAENNALVSRAVNEWVQLPRWQPSNLVKLQRFCKARTAVHRCEEQLSRGPASSCEVCHWISLQDRHPVLRHSWAYDFPPALSVLSVTPITQPEARICAYAKQLFFPLCGSTMLPLPYA